MSEDAPFTEEQPRHGDVILVCTHDLSQTTHWFMLPPGILLRRGEVLKPKWALLCDPCTKKYWSESDGMDLKSLLENPVHVSHWDGDEPIIRVDPSTGQG